MRNNYYALLNKTRRINTLQKTVNDPVDFKRSDVLSKVIEANVFIVDGTEKLLGLALKQKK